jgi:hypothetical protein
MVEWGKRSEWLIRLCKEFKHDPNSNGKLFDQQGKPIQVLFK